MPELRLGVALNLLLRTMPILLIRLGATLLFWVVALVYLAIVGGVAFLIAQAIEIVGVILFIIALVSVIPLYNLAYRYVFYMIKAAHVAVMAELIENDKLPDGVNQLEWGRQKVQSRFLEMNAMFDIDEIVTGVVRAFTRTVYNIARFLPGDTIDTLIRVINRVIEYALKYVDEAVLARSFWHEEEDVWENARDGVVLYAMAWKPLLTAAVALMAISFLPSIAAFLIFAAPIGAILAFVNPELAGWSLIFLLLFAWLIKVAIGDAFAVAAIISTYRRETRDLVPDEAMAAQLDQVSDQFGELARRAQEAIKPTRQKPEQSTTTTNQLTQTDTPPTTES